MVKTWLPLVSSPWACIPLGTAALACVFGVKWPADRRESLMWTLPPFEVPIAIRRAALEVHD